VTYPFPRDHRRGQRGLSSILPVNPPRSLVGAVR
jgi:hypothetical protein